MPETTLPGRMFANVARRLPQRVKRMIFIFSLSTKVAPRQSLETDHLSVDTLKSINDLMHVCARPGAMMVPSMLYSVIWNGREVPNLTELASEDEASQESFIARIQRQVPSWLRYDKVETDIRTLVKNHNSVFHGPVTKA